MTQQPPTQSGSTARLPATINLRWCTRCPRTDRFTNLKERHYSAGKLCPGEVRVATYVLTREGRPTT